MGKRSDFQRSPRDYYRTIDPRAVEALLPHLEDHTSFCEPCAGAGDLIDQLTEYGHWCPYACDIDPQRDDIDIRNALHISAREAEIWDCFITNPPFSRAPLKSLITHLSGILPTWMLLPADMAHNVYMAEHLKYCHKIVSIGRLWWQPNKLAGKDNFAWYLFDQFDPPEQPEFYGRNNGD